MLMLQQLLLLLLLLLLLIHPQEPHGQYLSSQDYMRAMSLLRAVRQMHSAAKSLCAFSTQANYPQSLWRQHRHELVLEHLKLWANYILCFAYTRTC